MIYNKAWDLVQTKPYRASWCTFLFLSQESLHHRSFDGCGSHHQPLLCQQGKQRAALPILRTGFCSLVLAVSEKLKDVHFDLGLAQPLGDTHRLRPLGCSWDRSRGSWAPASMQKREVGALPGEPALQAGVLDSRGGLPSHLEGQAAEEATPPLSQLDLQLSDSPGISRSSSEAVPRENHSLP